MVVSLESGCKLSKSHQLMGEGRICIDVPGSRLLRYSGRLTDCSIQNQTEVARFNDPIALEGDDMLYLYGGVKVYRSYGINCNLAIHALVG